MGIGASIFLIAAGLFLVYGLKVDLDVINVDAVGWICVLSGALGLIVTLTIFAPRRQRAQRAQQHQQHYVRDDRTQQF